MNILIANDDGIQAEGIKRLAETLSEVANIYLFAPSGQRSAFSHALTTGKEVRFKRVDFPGTERAYAVDGTPADCVKMGLHILRQEGISIDMVYTGINHGGNLSTDTLYSGTVSSAYEGVIKGIPSVALSVDSHGATHFDYACKMALKIMDFAKTTANSGSLISINTPDRPAEEIKGLKVVKMDEIGYADDHIIEKSGEEEIFFTYSSRYELKEDWDEDVDAKVLSQGYATVTMVKYDLNDYAGIEKLKGWQRDGN